MRSIVVNERTCEEVCALCPRVVLALLLAACGTQPDLSADLGVDGGIRADIGQLRSDLGGCVGVDADNDGVPDECDICPQGPDDADADADAVPDACDACPGFSDFLDSDADSIPDGCDVCASGDDRVDADGDGIPDACDMCDRGVNDADADSDGVPDACDACEGNDDSVDGDSDGVPDGCDVCAAGDDGTDMDGDSTPDACDVCAGEDDRVDTDGDTTPDGCDCEPSDSSAFPGGTEVCDGVDNDCVNGIDDGLAGCTVCPLGTLDWDLDTSNGCEEVGAVVFVDGSASGTADGTSWANAFTQLSDALTAAATPGVHAQVWIAEGEYVAPAQVAFDVLNGVSVVGGFIGGEVSVAERHRDAAPVLIRGNGVAAIRLAGQSVLASVMVSSGSPGVMVEPGAVASIHDVVLRENSNLSAEGVALTHRGASLVFTDSLVEMNASAGGAVVVAAGSATIRQVAFDQNASILGAAGLLVGSSAVASVDRSYFARSTAVLTSSGTPIAVAGNLTLTNSAVLGNSVLGTTSGVLVTGVFTAINSTFSGNTGNTLAFPDPPSGSAVHIDGINGAATLTNCIVWGNSTPQVDVGVQLLTSSVESEPGSCDPLFADASTLEGIALGSGSTCIDAGDSSPWTAEPAATDLVGAARLRGAEVDLGALESPSP